MRPDNINKQLSPNKSGRRESTPSDREFDQQQQETYIASAALGNKNRAQKHEHPNKTAGQCTSSPLPPEAVVKFLNQSINDLRALIDDRDMTIEDEGLFHRMTHLACRREEHLLDDDAQNARMLRVDVRSYRRIKKRLIAIGVIRIADSRLFNETADQAMTAYDEHRKRASDGGRKSAALRISAADEALATPQLGPYVAPTIDPKSVPVSCSNSKLAATTPKPSPKPNPKEDLEREEEALSLSRVIPIEQEEKAATSTVVSLLAKPIDSNWKPSEPDRKYALDRGLSDEEIDEQSEAFVSHFLQTAKDPLSRNWSERWKAWIRRYDPSKRRRKLLSTTDILKASSATANAGPYAGGNTPDNCWLNPLERFVRTGRWMGDDPGMSWCGPRPGNPNCRVPPRLLERFGLAGIAENELLPFKIKTERETDAGLQQWARDLVESEKRERVLATGGEHA